MIKKLKKKNAKTPIKTLALSTTYYVRKLDKWTGIIFPKRNKASWMKVLFARRYPKFQIW